MGWKRRRDRWRKLPTPSEHGLGFGVHWGRYQKIPKVPGGPELTLSTSGEVNESRPWSLAKWIVILSVGTVVAVLVFPSLFTWLFWAGLGAFLIVLTYRTWRG
jgi:hypothetical protein